MHWPVLFQINRQNSSNMRPKWVCVLWIRYLREENLRQKSQQKQQQKIKSFSSPKSTLNIVLLPTCIFYLHNRASHQPINPIWSNSKMSSPNWTNSYSILSKTVAVDPWCQSVRVHACTIATKVRTKKNKIRINHYYYIGWISTIQKKNIIWCAEVRVRLNDDCALSPSHVQRNRLVYTKQYDAQLMLAHCWRSACTQHMVFHSFCDRWRASVRALVPLCVCVCVWQIYFDLHLAFVIRIDTTE